MGKVIFRKIGGRLVPISVTSDHYGEMKRISAHAVNKIGEKVKVGHAEIHVPKQGVSATLVHVKTESHFRQKGIARGLIDHAMEEIGGAGKKFLRTDSIIHPATTKILGQKQTKFIGYGSGIRSDENKKLTKRKALEYSKNIHMSKRETIHQPKKIKSTTMIPKKFRSK